MEDLRYFLPGHAQSVEVSASRSGQGVGAKLKRVNRRRRIEGMSASLSNQESIEAPIRLASRRRWQHAFVGARDEPSLLRAAQRGSADAVEALVRHHWDSLHKTAYLIVQDAGAAEDIAQEAMLAAVRAIDRFDPRRPLQPWLHRIAANRSLDWLRARARRNEVAGNESGLLGSLTAPDSVSNSSGEILAALGVLQPDERALVVLCHVGGYRPSEIAKVLEVPAATVRTRLHRARGRLRAELEHREGS